jgi:hypothetical protein
LTLIDLGVKTKLLLDSIDAWILIRRSLIDQRRRALLPVVRERQAAGCSNHPGGTILKTT